MASLRVFIGSTFYDLKAVREELESFIGGFGYEPILSENGSISYRPGAPLEEYCYEEIKSADIFVSIIGGSFGTESKEGGLSIAQKELETALKARKQVYIFIEKEVDVEFQIYQKNKDNNTQYCVVKDTRIFRFIEEIKNLDKNNNIKLFEKINDIKKYLTVQLAGLFAHLLKEQENPISDNKEDKKIQSSKLVSNNGIIEKNKITNTKLDNEAFYIEMLQKPIRIKKIHRNIIITIDRGDVQECAFTNAGKKILSERYINSETVKKDKLIHSFLCGAENNKNAKYHHVDLSNDFKLRWASGGVLSVVKYKNEYWVPLFFRDIRPYGWNVALGSSERFFDEKSNQVSSEINIEDELNHPNMFVCREFSEETLIIDGLAKEGLNNSNKILVPFAPAVSTVKFEKKHLSLRKDEDKIEICKANDIFARDINTSMTIKVIPPNNNKITHDLSSVLVCFSLLDLGVEVVKLIKYQLPDKCEILDGEYFFNKDDNKYELTRMPVALFSLQYLQSIFSGKNALSENNYTFGTNPSIRINESIDQKYVHFFEWDINKRLDIVKGKVIVLPKEKQRYTDWYDKFGANFIDSENKISKANVSRLFTPATAKLLNLFFCHTDSRDWEL